MMNSKNIVRIVCLLAGLSLLSCDRDDIPVNRDKNKTTTENSKKPDTESDTPPSESSDDAELLVGAPSTPVEPEPVSAPAPTSSTEQQGSGDIVSAEVPTSPCDTPAPAQLDDKKQKELLKIAFPDAEETPPHFAQVRVLVGKSLNDTQRCLLDITAANAMQTISNMQAILKEPFTSIKRLQDDYVLSRSSMQSMEEMKAAVAGEANIIINQAVIVTWQSAALYELIRIATRSTEYLDRLTASAALLETLKFVEDSRFKEIAQFFTGSGVFTDCGNFYDCFEMVSKVAVASETIAYFLSEPEYLPNFQARLNKVVVSPFLRNILLFRMSTIVNHARLLELTGMHNPEMAGVAPHMAQEDIDNMRAALEFITGPQGFWESTLNTLRNQYDAADPEKTDYEKMVDLLTTHLIAEYKKLPAYRVVQGTPQDVIAQVEMGLIDENMKKRSVFQRENMANGPAEAQMWVKTLPERLMDGLMIAQYSNKAILMYLMRIEHGAENYLKFMNISLKPGLLFEQNSFDPIAGFISLAFFAKNEFRLPTRGEWRETLMKYSKALIDYAEPFELTKQRENPRYDFLDTTFVKQVQVPLDVQYVLAENSDALFVMNTNQEVFLNNTSTLVAKEKWLAAHMSGFNSLYHQYIRVADSQAKLAETANELQTAIGSVNQERLGEKLMDEVKEYAHDLFTAVCYGYWLPLDEDGRLVELKEGQSVETIVKNKPEWQKTYHVKQNEHGQHMFNDATFDLTKVCGGNAKNVNIHVAKFLADYFMKGQPRTDAEAWAREITRVGGDMAVTLGAFAIMSPAFSKVHSFGLWVAKKFIRFAPVRGSIGIVGRFTGLISEKLGRKFLRRQGLYWTHQLTTATLNSAIFTFTDHMLYQGLNWVNQATGTDYLPGRPFMNWNYDLSTIENISANFQREMAFGAGLFLVVPQFSAIAKRQIYTRSPLNFWRYKVNMAHIDRYYMTRGLHKFVPGEGVVIGKTGYGMVEEAASVLLPITYNGIAFSAVPFGIRSVDYLNGSGQSPWQGAHEFWTVDVARGFQNASLFGAYHIVVSNPRWRSKTNWKDTTEVNKYYKALGLKPGRTYSVDELTIAYNKAPKATNEQVTSARLAYETLRDSTRQALYDQQQLERTFGWGGFANDLRIIGAGF